MYRRNGNAIKTTALHVAVTYAGGQGGRQDGRVN